MLWIFISPKLFLNDHVIVYAVGCVSNVLSVFDAKPFDSRISTH